MTKDEYNVIKQIIDNETDCRELQKIRLELDNRMTNVQDDSYKKREVIYEKLIDFIDKNFIDRSFYNITKEELNIKLLLEEIKSEKEIDDVDDVYVGDLFDSSIIDMAYNGYCGDIEKTINKINESLKKYGISLDDDSLRSYEIYKLREMREEKEFKIK